MMYTGTNDVLWRVYRLRRQLNQIKPGLVSFVLNV